MDIVRLSPQLQFNLTFLPEVTAALEAIPYGEFFDYAPSEATTVLICNAPSDEGGEDPDGYEPVRLRYISGTYQLVVDVGLQVPLTGDMSAVMWFGIAASPLPGEPLEDIMVGKQLVLAMDLLTSIATVRKSIVELIVAFFKSGEYPELSEDGALG